MILPHFDSAAGDTVDRNSGHTAQLPMMVRSSPLDPAAAAAAAAAVAADDDERAHYPDRTRVRL